MFRQRATKTHFMEGQVVDCIFGNAPLALDDPAACISNVFSPQQQALGRTFVGLLSSAQIRDRVCVLVPGIAPSIHAALADAWRDAISSCCSSSGDCTRGRFERGKKLVRSRVPEEAKHLVAESCEKWAALLCRMAQVHVLEYGDILVP